MAKTLPDCGPNPEAVRQATADRMSWRGQNIMTHSPTSRTQLLTATGSSQGNALAVNAETGLCRTSVGPNLSVPTRRCSFQHGRWTPRHEATVRVPASDSVCLSDSQDNHLPQIQLVPSTAGPTLRQCEAACPADGGRLTQGMAGQTQCDAGRISTAEGGQTSSPVRSFLKEVPDNFLNFLNVSNFVPLCRKKCTSRVQKCPTATGKNVPANVQKCPTLTHVWQ